MRRTELLQEVRIMRFEEAYEGWQQRRLTQAEAARMLGVCECTFRRHMNRYEGSVNLGSDQVQGSVNGTLRYGYRILGRLTKWLAQI